MFAVVYYGNVLMQEMQSLACVIAVTLTSDSTTVPADRQRQSTQLLLTSYGHTMRKQVSCLEKERMQGTMPGARRRRRTTT